MEIIDADKFVLEQVYRPYQSILGFEEKLLKQPYSNEKTLELLQSDSDWSRLTLDRIKRCNFTFSQWLNHPVINYIIGLPNNNTKTIQWQKDYDFDSLYDLERDIHESFDERFNPNVAKPKTDENGVFKGVYRVTIEYLEKDL